MKISLLTHEYRIRCFPGVSGSHPLVSDDVAQNVVELTLMLYTPVHSANIYIQDVQKFLCLKKFKFQKSWVPKNVWFQNLLSFKYFELQ